MKDEIIRLTVADGAARAFLVTARDTVEEARRIHNSSPVVTAASGRLLSAGAMMGLTLGDDKDKLSLLVRGDGPVGSLLVTANSFGEVKGYAQNPQVEVPNKVNGKLNVSGVVGKGTLTVIKDMGVKEPFAGTVELLSSEIAEDIAYYYVQSEQTPSAVALGVHVAPDYTVEVAGGYMVQMLPFADESLAERIENKILELGPVTELYRQGHTVDSLAEALFGDLTYEITQRQDLAYVCDCSKDRMKALLLSLGATELEDMLKEDQGAEVLCHFCNSKYNFNSDDLEMLIEFINPRL